MDFGIGFLSNNVMLPILDFFYGLVPSYGLAIVALTLVVRFAVFPLSAGSIRNMRKTKVVQPIMQQRQQEIRDRYKDDPAKQQEEMGKLLKEFGNPLAGCLPVLFQMPILFALFATLRGSPFANTNYTANIQVLPQEKIEQVTPQAFATKPQNIYIDEGLHAKVAALLPSGTRLGVGERSHIEFQTVEGESFDTLEAQHPNASLKPQWTVTKGADKIQITEDGSIVALAPGDATIQGTIPGLAADRGFLFIQALGRVGARNPDNSINWDIVGMVLAFGLSLYVSQTLTGQGGGSSNPQQESINKITPVLFSGMFLFFPLPAGVLMYMVIANIFQTAQTFFLMREPLPENVQQILDAQKKQEDAANNRLAFEPKGAKQKAKEVETSAKPTSPAAKTVKASPNKGSSAKGASNKGTAAKGSTAKGTTNKTGSDKNSTDKRSTNKSSKKG